MQGGRAIGAIGLSCRVVAGVALIVVPIASFGLAPWDVAGALVAFPLLSIALYLVLTAVFGRRAGSPGAVEASRSGITWAINVSALILLLAIGTGVTFVTPIDAGAIWLFLGVSLLIVAVRGDAGCEALAIPNALAGRRDRTGCIAFAPIDSLEEEGKAVANRVR